MSRHNSRVGFEFSQELRLDNQLLVLRKYETKTKTEQTRSFIRPTPSNLQLKVKQQRQCVCTHQQQATLSNYCCSLALSEFIEIKWSQHQTKAQEKNWIPFTNSTQTESKLAIRGRRREIPRFGPKVLSAISAPVRTHLSPPSFLPPPSNKKAIKRYN